MNFDKDKLNTAFSLIDDAISKKDFPGAAAAVGTRDEIVKIQSFGNRCIYPDTLPLNRDTLFDLASLTKVVATNTLFMLFLEKGLISVYDKVNHYLPNFKGEGRENITIFNLLTHTAGFSACKPLYKICKDYETAIDYICNSEIEFEPGSRCIYSDFSYILLGYILEKIGGDRLDRLCEKYIFKPLKMDSTCFNPKGDNIAATEVDQETGKPFIGICHDENGRFFNGISGHAGLFSNIKDLCKFAHMLINEGNGFLSPASFSAMIRNHTSKLEEDRGYGWCVKGYRNSSGGDIISEVAFGHTGFTGTSLWVDTKKDVFIILLTNRVHPTRDNSNIIRFRRLFSNAVVSSLSR